MVIQRTPLPPHSIKDEMVQDSEASWYSSSWSPRRPLSLERGLREFCQIPGSQYFIAALQPGGDIVTHSAPLPLEQARFFSGINFRSEVDRAQTGSHQTTEQSAMDIDEGTSSSTNIMVSRVDGRGGTARRQRSVTQVASGANVLAAKIPLTISDDQAVWNLYEQRFKDCHQAPCKTIAKAWIRAVEPRKQSTHPYTGGEETKPDWWPRPWGTASNQRVIHKEPDHIPKFARVRLLVHILRLVVEPIERQHPAIQRGNLNVQRLEAVTWEALGAFFNDTDSPNSMARNAAKRPYLEELFKVARKEESYKNGEIDGLTEVHVMPETGDRRTQVSRLASVHDLDSDDEEIIPTPTTSSVSSPVAVHPTRGLASQLAANEQMEASHYSGSPPIDRDGRYPHLGFSMGLPVSSSSPTSIEGTHMMGHPSHYPHGQVGVQNLYHGFHGTERRPPLFQSPSLHEAYPHWQTSNASTNPPSYVFGDPHQTTQDPYGDQVAHGGPYMGPFDDMMTQPHDYMRRSNSHPGTVHGLEEHAGYTEACGVDPVKSEGLLPRGPPR